MRGEDERSGALFSYVDLEARVGQDHPLRTIRAIVNEALAALSRRLFSEIPRIAGAQGTATNVSKRQYGGGGGIRTRDTVSRIHTFQACAFGRSATPPTRCTKAANARR